MQLFKKKKKLVKPGSKVYMPYKKSTIKPVKRKKKFSISKKKGLRRRKNKLNVFQILLYIAIPISAVALLYVSALFIINTRGKGNVEEYEESYVIGIEDIPAYPNSEFIFAESIEEASVANFISSGNSAYRLPLDKDIDDAYEYYNEKLSSLGWVFVLSVETGSEEMKSGQYWVKDTQGLRLYSKFEDIWYELITEEEARTGLKSRVEQETERDLLLANQELQDFLPDYPWVMQIPKEYIISYSVAEFENMRIVDLRKIGTEEKLIITPLGYTGDSTLDGYLQNYISSLNSNGDNWIIENTILSSTPYGSALKGTIVYGSETNQVAIIPNTYNNVMYILDSNLSDDSFFEYAISNLQPQGLEDD